MQAPYGAGTNGKRAIILDKAAINADLCESPMIITFAKPAAMVIECPTTDEKNVGDLQRFCAELHGAIEGRLIRDGPE